ncbi:YqzL family protein [Paenibacillus sp. MWE-103]|uniref:YqzL family protein n=1 Tax=Paenibacillus artemisiicola TaxID=1172618 RepID=A0ABS3W6R5_9BACL|nr:MULTISPECIES: YqzL family protein [Paenibacillus]MBO7743830.1 YqzL family protein [Paenibacillus artemisiicola]SFI61330.1 YqzL-like protein [Paenibacillus sp. UNC496MF]
MRTFSWKYFTLTGDVEAFLLYREMERHAPAESVSDDEEGEPAAESDGAT